MQLEDGRVSSDRAGPQEQSSSRIVVALASARRKSDDRTKSQLRGVARRYLRSQARRQLLHGGTIGPRGTWRFGVTGGESKAKEMNRKAKVYRSQLMTMSLLQDEARQGGKR